MKVLAQIAAPDETLWPYNESQFRTQPPANVFAAATPHKATRIRGSTRRSRTCE